MLTSKVLTALRRLVASAAASANSAPLTESGRKGYRRLMWGGQRVNDLSWMHRTACMEGQTLRCGIKQMALLCDSRLPADDADIIQV